MRKKLLSPIMVLFLLALWVSFSTTPVIAYETHLQTAEPPNLGPDNTIILANKTDARFSQDFSTLLKHLRLEWLILDGPVVPDAVRDKNLILIGRPDAEFTGEIIGELLTAEELKQLRSNADHPVVIEKPSPWIEGRLITICSGADLLLTRDAAEVAVRAIINDVPPASDWIQTTYEAELDEDVHNYVDYLRYGWDDEELPLTDLTIDVEAGPRWRISTQEAEEDVERLFYLLSHGYAGYAFFNEDGEFEQARERILQELSSKSSWSGDALSSLLHEHLSFIVDCHMKIGDYQMAEHADFWYDANLELTLGSAGYQFTVDDETYLVMSINGSDPAPFIFPSLNQHGQPIYRLGLLSEEERAPLMLTAENQSGERNFEVELQRSDFSYYSEDVFREDVIGGIPVIRIRAFSDYYAEELRQFVETADTHRGEPVIIVDIRGNGGGNESWPISWIQRLTHRRPESVFITSEMESKTSMIARANAFNYWIDQGISFSTGTFERYSRTAEMIESGARQPGWTGTIYPQMPLIPNDTTVIMITNAEVASAGEGFVMRISQAENVVVVGENSMGALTFGNISLHQLPNSRLKVWLPINFGLYLDMEIREGVGLMPDLWVPAADAVNYAVAAVRSGAISTAQPLTPDILQQDFTPENTMARVIIERLRFLLVVAIFAAGGFVWAYFMRKKPRILTSIGAVWVALGSIWILIETEKPVGFGMLLVGAICLCWGGYNIWTARSVPSFK